MRKPHVEEDIGRYLYDCMEKTIKLRISPYQE